MTRSFELTAIFRQDGNLAVPAMMNELHTIAAPLSKCSPLLDHWLLRGMTKADALLHEAFGPTGPTNAAIAVLTESLKHAVDPRVIGIWNGQEGPKGASLQYIGRKSPETSTVVLRAKPLAFAKDWQRAGDLIAAFANLWKPAAMTLESAGYFDHRTFMDRPGVGWMLYLPRAITAQQVPEARAIIPVFSVGDAGRLGTIIVSVIDEPFSDENSEHVKIANAIETRLVDQDLLPRFADL